MLILAFSCSFFGSGNAAHGAWSLTFVLAQIRTESHSTITGSQTVDERKFVLSMATNPVMKEWRWLNVRPLPVRVIQLFASYIFYFCASSPSGTAPGRDGKVFFAELQRGLAIAMAEAGGEIGL